MGIWFNRKERDELISFKRDESGVPLNNKIHYLEGNPKIYLADHLLLYWGKGYPHTFENGTRYFVNGIIEYLLHDEEGSYSLKEKKYFIKEMVIQKFNSRSGYGYLGIEERVIELNDSIHLESKIKKRYRSSEVEFLGIKNLDFDCSQIHLKYKTGTEFFIPVNDFNNQFQKFFELIGRNKKFKIIGENDLRFHLIRGEDGYVDNWKDKISIINQKNSRGS